MNITKLITENVAPETSKYIGLFDNNKNLIAKISIPDSKVISSNLEPNYSFGLISDVHLGKSADPNEQEDFRRALRFFNGNIDNGTETSTPEERGSGEGLSNFICVIGDIADTGTDAQLTEYTDLISIYSPETPVYTLAGNHDAYSGDINSNWETITGRNPNFVLTHNDNAAIGENDVFIFVSVHSYSSTHITNHGLFSKETLLWLYQQLETYRNKRCFIFQHVRPTNGSGNAYGVYTYNIWLTSDEGTVFFEELMNHYKNTIFFHGHSHLRFQFQDSSVNTAKMANYSYNVPASGGRPSQAFRSVHVPSVACIRQSDKGLDSGNPTYLYYGSEGYKVDVYDSFIILKGRDFNGYDSGVFENGSIVPISYGTPSWIPQAFYKIDTTLVNIAANTFTTTTHLFDGDPQTDENGYYIAEYIESSGTQYFDTGIYGEFGMDVEADIEIPSSAQTYNTLIGSTPDRCYIFMRSDNRVEIGANNFNSVQNGYELNTRYNLLAHWESGNNYIQLNETIVVTDTDTTLNNTYPLFFCARNNAGVAERFGNYRIYSMQIKKNGTLVADYVPRINPQTNAAGMYDKITNTFKPSVGTNNFQYKLISTN